MRRLLFTGMLALAALAVVPAAASAAAACTHLPAVANGTLSISLDGTPSAAKVTIQRSGAEIVVLDANGTDITVGDCGGTGNPTVTNTSVVLVEDPVVGDAVNDTTVIIDEQGGAFEPGNDGAADPEIDFQLLMKSGTDTLQFNGTDNADNFLLGEDAAGNLGGNMNPASSTPDLFGQSVERAVFNGRKGDDTISAVGSASVPELVNPLTLDSLTLDGGNQNDTLRGGSGPDQLQGGTQDDDLNGGGGNDTQLGEDDNDSFQANAGGDSIDGGNGLSDVALYTDRTNAVNVTIDGVANDGSGEDNNSDNVLATVENVKSGPGSDFLTGSIGTNDLTGNGGNDTVDGGGGNDKVSGSEGLDRLLGNSGNDNLFGGTDRDNLVGGSGNDRLTGNSGPDFLLGKNGIDRLIAKDGTRDKRINCGKGSNKRESFTRDAKDPRPKSC